MVVRQRAASCTSTVPQQRSLIAAQGTRMGGRRLKWMLDDGTTDDERRKEGHGQTQTRERGTSLWQTETSVRERSARGGRGRRLPCISPPSSSQSSPSRAVASLSTPPQAGQAKAVAVAVAGARVRRRRPVAGGAAATARSCWRWRWRRRLCLARPPSPDPAVGGGSGDGCIRCGFCNGRLDACEHGWVDGWFMDACMRGDWLWLGRWQWARGGGLPR